MFRIPASGLILLLWAAACRYGGDSVEAPVAETRGQPAPAQAAPPPEEATPRAAPSPAKPALDAITAVTKDKPAAYPGVAIPALVPSTSAVATACGTVGNACCPGHKCDSGSTCVMQQGRGDAICQSCGEPGQLCCDDGRCNGGCCARISLAYGDLRCIPSNAACGITPGDLCGSDGQCTSSCGALDQACCGARADKWCHAPGTACVPSPGRAGQPLTCAPCGHQGQPCCTSKNDCTDPLSCQMDPARGYRVCL